MASRFGGIAQKLASRPEVPAGVGDSPAQPGVSPSLRATASHIEWSDDRRPAGSSYSIEEWEAAEEGGTNVVFEVVKPNETGLVAMPRDGMNGIEAMLYCRSLLIPEDMPMASALPYHATVIHRDPVLGEREVMKYRLVRAEVEAQKSPFLNGSVLRNDLEVAYQESQAKQARPGGSSRFGSVAQSQRPRG